MIEEALKRRKMKQTSTVLALTIDDPRDALAEFRGEHARQEDIDCFSRTMDIVEHGLPDMVARANAWAVGDIDALRSMPIESQYRACLSAWSSSEVVRKRGMTDIEQRVRAKWLATAEAALQKNRITFATLPVSQLVKPDGYLVALQAKGYQVEAPE